MDLLTVLLRTVLLLVLLLGLLLGLVGSEAQNLKNVIVEPGHNVTLTCSVNSSDIYWSLNIHSQFRVGIGRIRSSSSPQFCQSDLRSKFKMSGNQLEIRNVSAEDSRLYYCGIKQNDEFVDQDAFSLLLSVVYPTTSVLPSPRPSTPPCPTAGQFLQPLMAVSLGLNAALLAAVIGFLCVCMRRNSCCSCCCCRAKDSAANMENDDMQNDDMQNDDMQNPQYEEIQLPPTLVPVPVRVTSECIYYKAQHPNPKIHRH